MKNGASESGRRCSVLVFLVVFTLKAIGEFPAVTAIGCANTHLEHTRVYLSVNVVANTLQVSWQNVDEKVYYLVLAGYDYVGTFGMRGNGNFEFYKNGAQYVFKTINPTTSHGFEDTGISFDRTRMDNAASDDGRFGYYVYLTTSDGKTSKKYCMRVYTTWMNDLRSRIGSVSLNRLFIPGTHNSASYLTANSARDIEIKHKYSITQDFEDIRSQLRMGARYLDIRVGQYPSSDEPFWTNHNHVSMHTLRNVLTQVREFVLETNEIVIFDIHQFPIGFSSRKDHQKLIDFIHSMIADVMVNPSIGWDGTLNQIWASGRRIIVGYGNADAVNVFSKAFLWPATKHRWGEVDDKGDLEVYLYGQHRNGNERHTAVTDIALLTPRNDRIVGDSIVSGLLPILTLGLVNPLANPDLSNALFSGIKQRAQEVNRDVTSWYFNDLGPTANIVAVDYMLGTNIVEAAMYWNVRR